MWRGRRYKLLKDGRFELRGLTGKLFNGALDLKATVKHAAGATRIGLLNAALSGLRLTRDGADWATLARLALALGVTAVGSAVAADYPVRPVRFVVPYAAGGGSDIIARVVGLKLA